MVASEGHEQAVVRNDMDKDMDMQYLQAKGLCTSKVNPLIWSQLSPPMKAQDAKSQKSQNTMIGSVTAMVKAANLAVRNHSQDRDLIALLTDAIVMALQCHHEINHSRHMAMKKELNNDYAALCNPNAVEGTSEFLFGDLSKLAKDITEANKLTKKVHPPHHTITSTRGDRYGGRLSYGANQGNRRFQPYQRGNSSAFFRQKPILLTEKEKERGGEPVAMNMPEVCNVNMPPPDYKWKCG